MLKNLDFDEEILNIKMQHYIKTLDIVRTAVNVKNIFTEESIEEACDLVDDMNLDSEYFEKVARRIKASYLKNL